MPCRTLLIITMIAFLFFTSAAEAQLENSMQFKLEALDMGYLKMGRAQNVYAEGEIRKGTAKQLFDFANTHSLKPGATVYLNSNGGDVIEAIRLARVIESLGFNTGIGIKDRSAKAYCLSACAVAYLGGIFRYVWNENQIYGVHRFFDSSDKSSKDDLEISQIISSEILKLIEDKNIDPKLFQIMAAAGRDEMIILQKNELHSLNVVNNGAPPPTWEMLEDGDGVYLLGTSADVRGTQQIYFDCDKKLGLVVTAAFESADANHVLKYYSDSRGLLLDGKQVELSVTADSENRMIRAYASIPSPLKEKLLNTTKIGFYMSPQNREIFAGFEIKHTPQSKTFLRSVISSCDAKALQK